MADRPILFSAPMVQALLAGRKTQTRRFCKWANNPNSPALSRIVACNEPGWFGDEEGDVQFQAGFTVGDRLWVRESYFQRGHWWEDGSDLTAKGKPKWKFAPYDHEITFDAPIKYLKARSRTKPSEIQWHKRLGRFMPRRYSRLTLITTDVRVERLQDCSESDAMAEGVEMESADPPFYYVPGIWPHSITGVGIEESGGRHAVRSYAKLWDHINGPGAWDANPWVVAVSFDVRKGNIDG